MSEFLIVQNDMLVPPGHLAEAMYGARASHEVFAAYDSAGLMPPFADYAGVVILGGRMGVYDAGEYPFLRYEMDGIAVAAGAGVPVMGICLGGQLIAAALGGSVESGPRPEAALVTLADSTDPLLRLLERPHLILHQDGWTPPAGATGLVRGPSYHLAFRHGSAVALQTHPEVTPEIARRWFAEAEVKDLVRRAGEDAGHFLARILAGAPEMRDMARRYFAAWIEEARARSAA